MILGKKMSPYRSTPSTSQPEYKNLIEAFRAIKNFAKVVEKHVHVGGNSRDINVEVGDNILEQLERMGPPVFKGIPYPI